MPGKISRDELSEWFSYDPLTGVFTWRKRPARRRDNVMVGDIAGSIHSRTGHHPRRMLWLKDMRIYASRAAYMMMAGGIPDNAMIDHIDGDTLNDRFGNLRLASEAQNTWNRIGRGTKWKLGVSKDKQSRFKARIQMPDGRKFNLGSWDTEAEAHAAYMGAAAVLHGEFWIGNRDQEPVHLRALADSLNT